MLTETIGGECPACEYNRVLFRFGSEGYYQYVACPKCGFAYGTNRYDDEDFGEDVWQGVLAGIEATLKAKNIDVSVAGIYQFVEEDGEEYLDTSIGTLFDFGDFELEKFTPKKDLKDIKLKNHKNL